MRGNAGFTVFVERRISQLRRAADYDTQYLRSKWIDKLDALFAVATSIAKGEVNRQRVGGRVEFITPKQRQMWAHVAAHIALVMGNLAKGYDEHQFNEDLAELERLVDEIKKLQAQRTEEGDRATEANPADKCSETDIENVSNS
jgi:hypothetical protein